MREKTRGTGLGSTSLIMIFAVLCLTIFALLTLSTARANQALAEKNAEFSKEYYEADSRAVRIVAQIQEYAQTGEIPQTIDEIAIRQQETEDGKTVTYCCPVNESQALSVELALECSDFTVVSWKLAQTAEWEADGSFSVWDGE